MSLLLWILAGLVTFTVALAGWTWIEARRAERRVPPLGSVTPVSGARLHVAEAGDGHEGPAIVLIHGLAAQMRSLSWPLFHRLSDDFHVLAVDRPGSGYSTREPGLAPGIRGDAGAIAELLAQRGVERALVVGHSLGGAVALALAVHHPERVGGLALVAPLTHVVDEVPAVFRSLEVYSRGLRNVLSWTVAVPAVRLLQDRVLGEIFHPEPVHPDFGTLGGGLLSRRPASFRTASTDLLAVPGPLSEVETGYARVDVPVSILYGRQDRILDPEVQGVPMRERIPGCQVELVDGGHMLPITQPDRVANFIREAAARPGLTR